MRETQHRTAAVPQQAAAEMSSSSSTAIFRSAVGHLKMSAAISISDIRDLVKDLKQRGLLDSTVVHWGGEMGRLPVVQNDAGRSKIGRDHNTHGFSMWVAGGGFRSGHVHGNTDEWGHKAVEGVVNHYDYHATLLHLFGLQHEQLTFRRSNRDQTLTDGQPGQVVEALLT